MSADGGTGVAQSANRLGGVMDGMWLQQCIEEMNEVMLKPVRPEHQGIEERARGYCFGVAGFLQTIEAPPKRDHVDPRSIILHYCAFIPPKIYRALTGLNRESAQAALIAIERSREAWITMAERGLAPSAEADRFVSDLICLADDLAKLS